MSKLTLIILLLAGLLSACVSPVARLDATASRLNLTREVVADASATTQATVPLVSYTSRDLSQQKTLYIYLEGDGQPWQKGVVPATDPNTRGSKVLPLLAVTGGIYLARPCYGWRAMPVLCEASWWTSGRYSAEVVSGLSRAITHFKQQYPEAKLVLVGHSGGGNLAMLLAEQHPEVAAVLTLAGNLDHRAWTDYFAYLPLTNSLSSMDVTLAPTTARWHLIAGLDTVVPATVLQTAVAKDPLAKVLYYPDFTHGCCWAEVWPDVIEQLNRQLGEP